MKEKYEPSVFTKEWGQEISSGGYVQIPNDFIRNIGYLELSANEAMVIIAILSYGRDRTISADQLAEHLGISIRTVRTIFRNLDTRKKLMKRFRDKGEANRFTWPGLKNAVLSLAKDRQSYRQKRDRGLYNPYHDNEKIFPTNKEPKNKYKKEVGSFAQFKAERDRLIKKRSV